MSVLAPPPRDEQELLIREARARQRRRRLIAVAVVAVLAGAALGVYAVVPRAGDDVRQPTGSGGSAFSAPRCTPDQLALAFRPEGVAAGSVGDGFSLTNVSSERCAIRGWPRLAYVIRGGMTPLIHPHRTVRLFSSNLRVHTVVLRPGGSASFHLFSSDAATGGACPTTSAVSVGLPGQTGALRVLARIPYCGARWVWESAFATGRAGRWVTGA